MDMGIKSYITLLTSSSGTKCLYLSDNVNIFSVVLDLMASIRYCTPPSDILSHPYVASFSNIGLSLITSARLLAPCSPSGLSSRSSVFSMHHLAHIWLHPQDHIPTTSTQTVWCYV